MLLGVRGLWLLRVLLLRARELLTRHRCVQDRNQIVDLQGVQFPAGLMELHPVSLSAAAAVADGFRVICVFCAAVRAGFWLLRLLLLRARELLTRH